MRFLFPGWLALALVLLTTTSATAATPAVVSSMRNVNAVMDHQGFRINPAFDHSGGIIEGDLAPVQAFEIMRPLNEAVTIGRLYTSCTCIQLEAPKRNFAVGERAILQLRNTRPTPVNGQIYAIYVQITSPVRATLRFDTFVQSNTLATELNLAGDAADGDDETETTEATDVAERSEVVEADDIPADGVLEAETAEAQVYDSITDEYRAAGYDFGDIVEDSQELAAAADEPATESGAGEGEPELAGEYSSDSEREAVSAEVDARLAAAAAATREFADDMDAYFSDHEPEVMPEALPPPDELVDQFPADMAEVPADDMNDLLAEAEVTPVATPLEEAYQQSGSAQESGLAAPAPASPAGQTMGNIALITIGVRDLDKSVRFYEALGWRMAPRSKYDQTAFFQLNGQVLVLYPMPDLLKEQNMSDALPVPGGVTLALHVRSKDEVYETYQRFIDAGGLSLKEPTQMISGSVTSYVADPDGNPWEISWVPQFRVDENGWLWLP